MLKPKSSSDDADEEKEDREMRHLLRTRQSRRDQAVAEERAFLSNSPLTRPTVWFVAKPRDTQEYGND